MKIMNLYNTLTKKVEAFTPAGDTVLLYCCGPTVYDYAHIGNFRTYTMTDLLVRALKYFGYPVKYVMNVTDVGHLVSDADDGEDKMEKGAKREGKTAWDIAKFYTDAFIADSKKLNLLEPDVRPKPTEHIAEQIEMVKTLLDKQFAYQIDDGIYFDTSKLADYGKLTGQNIEELKAGARVEPNPQKRNPSDFALWKFSYLKGRSFDPAQDASKRDMEWDSPWGTGFPGWHIECSAMSMKHLGPQLDIHTGGADLIPVHHTNEIAQSEAATGKIPFVHYWVHGQFIQVNGEKMSKSKGNFYRLDDVIAKGYDPLALRYLYLTAQYRAYLNFTWESLTNAQNGLHQLRSQLAALSHQSTAGQRTQLSEEKLAQVDTLRAKFDEAVANDLNMPQALAVVWETLKSNIPSEDKYDLVMGFDEVLGLQLSAVSSQPVAIPKDIIGLANKREQLRKEKKFDEADEVRQEIEKQGYTLDDSPEGPQIKKI